LLSGGLDSSLIAALVADYFRRQGKTIETYSIGLAKSEDVKYARIVADYIGSNHHEIIVTEDDMFNAIPEVIEALESYDTTTVRASLGNYLIGKHIAQHSEAKVIFNGDGSDELFGGYLYMNKCPDDIEFDKETRRLLKDIHMFDVLRSDKSISSNGLEPRTPFLDRTFVNYVLSIPAYLRNHTNFKDEPEKGMLRRAFNDYFDDSLGRKILPDQILWNMCIM
jgi:asparagine synthase (glutamine-hydrolysing)